MADKKEEVEVVEEVNVDAALVAEIDAGVEVVIKDKEKPVIETEEKEFPVEKVLPTDEEGDKSLTEGDEDHVVDAEKDDSKKPAIDDSHIERAVKAGMSITDAREFKSADALERMCNMLEKSSDDSNGDDDEGAAKISKEGNDLLDGIPDLDPDEYDAEIVSGFKAMKDIIRAQNELINGIKGGSDLSWFDNQIDSLGEGFVESVGNSASIKAGSPQAGKRDELKVKFDVLTAGYKGIGSDKSRDEIFNEASKLVLGDVAAKVRNDDKSAKLGKRVSQHVSRPTGQNQKSKNDAFEDVSEMLDKKYFD